MMSTTAQNPFSKANYVATSGAAPAANPAEESAVRTWAAGVCPAHGWDDTAKPLHDLLKSGVVLCALANALQPGIIPAASIFAVDGGTASFKQMENIAAFVRAARALGCREFELFTTAGLFHARDLRQVVICLLALKRIDAETALKGGGLVASVDADHPMGPTVTAAHEKKELTAHAQEHFRVEEKVATEAVVAPGYAPFVAHAVRSGAFDAKASEFATATQASCCMAPPISEQELRESQARLDKMHNDKDRLTIIRALATNFSFSCAQIAAIVTHAHFGGGGIEAMALLWPCCSDKEQREVALGAFQFADEKEAVRAKMLKIDAAAAPTVVPKYYEVGSKPAPEAVGQQMSAAPWAKPGGAAAATPAAVSPWAKPAAAPTAPTAAAAPAPFGGGGGGGWSWKAKSPAT